MDKDQALKEVRQLREELNDHDYRYYVLAQPTISDYDYDMKMKRLEALEKEFPAAQFPEFGDPHSPSKRVSGEPTKIFPVVQHRKRMLSLSNTYNEAEIRDFDRRVHSLLEPDEPVAYVCELKIDGVAMSLIYENGNLLRAVTRGDGEKGDDVTANKSINKSPNTTDKCSDQSHVVAKVELSHKAHHGAHALLPGWNEASHGDNHYYS